MSENAIYEIAQMMHDKTNVQNDMEEAYNLISELFRKKYVSKIHKAIQSQQLQTKKNPPKEAQLLSAMKAFAHEEAHPVYDRMIDMMLTADTLQKMGGRINESSIHSDGIYDVDKSCMVTKSNNNVNYAGMLMMMSMLKRS